MNNTNSDKIIERRFAIGDIHGCGKTFLALLEKIQPTKSDHIYILGDLINRGKRTKKVIKTIISLQEDGYNIFALRGNHEEYLINAMNNNTPTEFIKLCKKIRLEWLIESKTPFKIKSKYYNFFNSLPYYYDLGDRLLSHAGFDLCNDNIFENKSAMLQQREHLCIDNFKRDALIIHGHTPISLNKITRSIDANLPIINIDNGCVYYSTEKNKAHLICINLDSLEIISQKNIE